MYRQIIVLILCSLLASCAATPPKYSQSDIASANTREKQVALYGQLEATLAAEGGGPNAATYTQLRDSLGMKLGEEEAARIWKYVTDSRMDTNVVPLNILNQAEKEAQPIQKWNRGEYDRLAGELSEYQKATETAIEKSQAMLTKFDPELEADAVPRVETLRRISQLYGDNVQADHAYKIAYEDVHNSLRIDAEQAMRNGSYADALKSLNKLKRLDPAYPGIDEQIATARSGMESSDFRQLLIDGDIEGAYAAFLRLSSNTMTYAQKREFIQPANNLGQYYADVAANLVRSRQYADAYESISRQNKIQNWTNEPSRISGSTMSQFTDSMFDLSLASKQQDRLGLEYGYLLLTQEFNPAYHTLETELRETGESVYDNAIRRVGSVVITSSDPSDQQIASQIAAGVREYLMENIPEDIKIVEREQIADVRREREISDDIDEHSDDFKDLESADYLIRGELLTAEVLADVKSVRSRKRVVIGQAEVKNPAHEDWVREKGVRKADHPDAPPRTIMQDTTEDIQLVVEEHRKVGEVGVTYRVVDSYNAELVHSETVSRTVKLSDQSQEGVQVGDFQQEAKLAELPSDLEIFTDLVNQVVDEVARDLVSFLANPEGDYFQNCKILYGESEFADAADQCAKAAVLKERKGLDNEEVVSLLKEVTLKSDTRSY